MDRILIRSAVVRIVFVVMFLLFALAASAHAEPPRSAVPEETRIAGALFTPSRTEQGLAWRAHWVLTPEAASDVAFGATRTVRFAVPLAAGASVEPTFGVTPVVEDGRVVGITVDRAGLDGRVVAATVNDHVRASGALGAPVASGTALQIVDAELGAGTRLEVEPGTTLERRVGYLAPPGTSHAARQEAQRLTGYAAHVSGAAVYVRGEDVRSAGGLRASVVTPQARSQRGILGIGVIFGALVLGLLAAVRRLRDAAGVERADAMLAAELDGLEGRSFNADARPR